MGEQGKPILGLAPKSVTLDGDLGSLGSVTITELLSLFHWITLAGLGLTWTVFLIGCLLGIYRQKRKKITGKPTQRKINQLVSYLANSIDIPINRIGCVVSSPRDC